MEVAIPLFDRTTALDAVGPYQVLSAIPGTQVRFLAAEPGPVRCDNRMLSLVAEGRFEDAPEPDILVVPGGIGTRLLLDDERILEWVRAVHETSRYTTSVCTGSLVLGAAGILDGLEATSHWMALEYLEELGARPTSRRVVVEGKVITAAGVSSGIDMALALTELLVGPEMAQGIQLAIEYDPQPPFDAGSPDKASPEIVELVRGFMQGLEDEAAAAVAE
jgi:putative intracellular protease/amidase